MSKIDKKLSSRLIFLISQPRSGSTLLQRVLGNHLDIHTVSEPWLMLHPLYALRSGGNDAEYNSHLAWIALQDFLQMLPGGEGEYIEGLRRMYIYLYERALEGKSKRYFLDKTPRYYFVIPELYRVFSEAHYIILLRNPLAVLCSVIKTWVKEDWFLLNNCKHDMIRAPHLLLDGIKILGNRCIVVHYENFVENPNKEIRRICEHLKIGFIPEIVEYANYNLPRWQFGDQEDVYQNIRPSLQNINKWKQTLKEPQMWRLANDYLQLLGREQVENMGYSYDKLRHILETSRPHRIDIRLTFPLAWLIDKPVEEHKSWLRIIVRMARSLQLRGISGTAVAVARKLIQGLSKSE